MIVADFRTPIWLGAIAILPIAWCSIGSTAGRFADKTWLPAQRFDNVRYEKRDT